METATREARDAIRDFTSDEEEREAILLFLSEAPIGDEYGVLSPEGRKLGQDYVDWLRARGVKAFIEPAARST